MRVSLLVAAIVTIVIPTGASIAVASAATPEIAHKNEVLEYQEFYRAACGKEPTNENLLKSLTNENVKGRNNAELIIALKLISLDSQPAAVAEQILACYERNTYWHVRIACADALVHVDKEKGIGLSRKIINDPDVGLEAKVLLARDLISVKVLEGYPALKEGLVSSDEHLRDMAMSLLDKFRPYDGAPYGESGQKVDISGTIAEAKKTAQSILNDLDKAATKTQPQAK